MPSTSKTKRKSSKKTASKRSKKKSKTKASSVANAGSRNQLAARARQNNIHVDKDDTKLDIAKKIMNHPAAKTLAGLGVSAAAIAGVHYGHKKLNLKEEAKLEKEKETFMKDHPEGSEWKVGEDTYRISKYDKNCVRYEKNNIVANPQTFNLFMSHMKTAKKVS